MTDNLDEQFHEDAKLILKHAIDAGVPAEWYWSHLKGHVISETTRLNSDIDFLMNRGDTVKGWYEKQIKEYTHRILIFGKKETEE
jgi:hypothetical protein